MKSWIKDAEVRRRIPEGCDLPTRFDDFLRAEPPFEVEWNDLDSYCLKPTATKEAVPFLRLSDGGLVAFWFCEASPAIVHIGGHGELKVLARSFDDFLKATGQRCSGLPDFDEAAQPFRVHGVRGKPRTHELPALQARFDSWHKEHTSLQTPLRTPESEELRQRVFQISEDMIRDGCSKVYTLASVWWSMNFRIERDGTGLSITYLDYGEWYPVSEKYELDDAVVALFQLVEHKTQSHYEMSTCSAGIVSIDRDRELVLVPPERGAK